MGRDRDRHKTEYDIDQLLKESFGMDDKTLLEKFQRAQIEIDDSQIPPEPEEGFERLLEKIEEEGIKPQYAPDRGPERSFGKRRRLRPALKVALAAGVVAVMLMATSITPVANKYFKYEKRVKYSDRNDVVLNNSANNKELEGKLEEAYKKIERELGIDVLKMDHMPSDMIYIKTIIMKPMAEMYFEYDGKSFCITQQIMSADNSTNIVSDRKEQEPEKIFNNWLNREIVIEKSALEGNEVEYSAEIIEGNSYYYLEGIMKKNDFIEIVKNVYIE